MLLSAQLTEQSQVRGTGVDVALPTVFRFDGLPSGPGCRGD